jgi:hypothetical protein
MMRLLLVAVACFGLLAPSTAAAAKKKSKKKAHIVAVQASEKRAHDTERARLKRLQDADKRGEVQLAELRTMRELPVVSQAGQAEDDEIPGQARHR